MAELMEFANDTFLNDADLAQQHALNISIDGLYSERYWVCEPSLTPTTSCIAAAQTLDAFKVNKHRTCSFIACSEL